MNILCSPKHFILCPQPVTVLFEDYAELEEEEEIEALESYWVQHFGVVTPNVKTPFKEEILTLGLELHETSRIRRHSRFGGVRGATISSDNRVYHE